MNPARSILVVLRVTTIIIGLLPPCKVLKAAGVCLKARQGLPKEIASYYGHALLMNETWLRLSNLTQVVTWTHILHPKAPVIPSSIPLLVKLES